MTNDRKSPLIIRSSDVNLETEPAFGHPLNPNSEVRGVSLGELTGMERIGVHIVAVTPGKEAFIYHSHTTEEEFVYVLSGRGIAEIADEEYEIGPGDFMGFPTPSVAHHIRNPFEEPLVYLMGREQQGLEIADFPRIGKRIIRVDNCADIVDLDDVHEFWRGEDED